nr:hypothetical protein CFP56_58125 [Quercus suber]
MGVARKHETTEPLSLYPYRRQASARWNPREKSFLSYQRRKCKSTVAHRLKAMSRRGSKHISKKAVDLDPVPNR